MGVEDGLDNWARASEESSVGAVRVEVEGAAKAADCRSRDTRAADAMMDGLTLMGWTRQCQWELGLSSWVRSVGTWRRDGVGGRLCVVGNNLGIMNAGESTEASRLTCRGGSFGIGGLLIRCFYLVSGTRVIRH